MVIKLRICVVLSVVSMVIGCANAQSDSEDTQFELLTASYSEYLQSINTTFDIQGEDAERWIMLFEDALSEWSNPLYRRLAWDVLISLNNTIENWSDSLFACENAILEATDDEVLFDFQYDRWTILQRFDGEQRLGEERLSVSESGAIAASTFMKLFQEDPQSKSVEDSAIKFVALAWSMVRDQSYGDRLKIARNLVKVGQLQSVSKIIGGPAKENHIGYLSGLLLEQSKAEEAAKTISVIRSEKGKLLTCTVALDAAKSEGVSELIVNKFLWAVSPQFTSDPLWLNLAVRHVMSVIESARLAKSQQLQTGDGAVYLGEVPSQDVLNLIEPSVSAMIATGRYSTVPGLGASPANRENFTVLHTSIRTLARVLELMGDHETAALYQKQTNPVLPSYLLNTSP